MSTNNIITICSVAVSLVVSVITICVELHKFRKESYNKRVTEERIKWLNKVRDDYSIVMAAYTLKSGTHNNRECSIDEETYNNRMYEAEKARFDLISSLNTNKEDGNEYNLFLKTVLEDMDFCSNYSEQLPDKEDIEIFKIYMNKMLEKEWSKSKDESKGQIK